MPEAAPALVARAQPAALSAPSAPGGAPLDVADFGPILPLAAPSALPPLIPQPSLDPPALWASFALFSDATDLARILELTDLEPVPSLLMPNILPEIASPANKIKVALTTPSPVDMPAGNASPRWQLSGTTRDSTGVALGLCRVVALDVGQLRVGGPAAVAEAISDGGGLFAIEVPQNTAYQLIAYLPGSPDVAGISVASLTPTAV